MIRTNTAARSVRHQATASRHDCAACRPRHAARRGLEQPRGPVQPDPFRAAGVEFGWHQNIDRPRHVVIPPGGGSAACPRDARAGLRAGRGPDPLRLSGLRGSSRVHVRGQLVPVARLGARRTIRRPWSPSCHTAITFAWAVSCSMRRWDSLGGTRFMVSETGCP